MKPREPRRKVMIGARLRHERGWSDARILNLSSRGLMVRASQAPPRGTYVEICRGPHRIVARVVWAERDLFGASARDAIALDAIVSDEEQPLAAAADLGNDRRAGPRPARPSEQHDRNRMWSRRLEFACVAVFACVAAFFSFDAVAEVLSKPLNLIEARLG